MCTRSIAWKLEHAVVRADDQHDDGKEDVAEQPAAAVSKKTTKKAKKAAKISAKAQAIKPAAKQTVGKVTRAMAQQQAEAAPEDDDIPDAGALHDGSDADASQMSLDTQEGDHDVKLEDFEREAMQRASSAGKSEPMPKRKASLGRDGSGAMTQAAAATAVKTGVPSTSNHACACALMRSCTYGVLVPLLVNTNMSATPVVCRRTVARASCTRHSMLSSQRARMRAATGRLEKT